MNVIVFVVAAFVSASANGTEKGESLKCNKDDLLTNTFKLAFKGLFDRTDSELVRSCFEAKTENINAMGIVLRDFSIQIEKILSEIFGPYRYRKPMKTISATYEKLPENLWPFVVKMKFKEALKVAETAGTTIDKAVDQIMYELKRKFPRVADYIGGLFSFMDDEGRRRSRYINSNFISCIEGEESNF